MGFALVMAVGCDATSTQPADTTFRVPPTINPAVFVEGVDNPFFPLTPGASYRYAGSTPDGEEIVVLDVLHEKKEIQGVLTTVVRDRVWRDGVLIEEALAWYAQDKEGDVWYFGEAAKEIDNGQVVSTAGSWESGVDGARAGVIMWAQPRVGHAYYQEYYEAEAEDRGRVLSLNETVTVPAGRFSGCVKTEDTTALEPGVVEHTYYCPGIGAALEVDLSEDMHMMLQAIAQP